MKDSNGNELEDFNEDTRPTVDQVEALLSRSIDEVVTKIGTLEDCTAENIDDLREAAGSLAAVRTAMRVERSYFPEQIRNDRSPYNALKEEWEDSSKSLVSAVTEHCGGSGDGGPGGGQRPHYSFDDDVLISRESGW